jgi:hypothetical protein
MRTITELTVIGAKINTCFDVIAAAVTCTGLTREDLEEFRRYLAEQDVMMPLTDPTTWKNGGEKMIQLAGKRTDVLLKVLPRLPETQEKRTIFLTVEDGS